ncbi:MAG: hypothetical protein K9L82_05830 [Chromatiaceae bacterium]|nr:hypothetical protein [Chromatiaceae bacterium]MCF7993351.1 hypothetical protein [Chromatiaceae bacterium]MCF8004844.1 hypothetical protein [Chromatiaceae bacterium]MCF8014208.1 hypothetical protein [Chromatiaceae bacterium]
MKKLIALTLLVSLVAPLKAFAEDWYAGVTFLQAEGMNACVIARFKASDGSYTLSQADALYTVLFGALAGVDTGDVLVDNQLPSQVQAGGNDGAGLLTSFINNGTSVCTFGGQPADAVGFLSTFRCEYQNENQMCFRLYIDAGENDLSMLGIPSGIATIGGIFVKRELWDVIMTLIMQNSRSGIDLLGGSSDGRSNLLDLIIPSAGELPPVAAE